MGLGRVYGRWQLQEEVFADGSRERVVLGYHDGLLAMAFVNYHIAGWLLRQRMIGRSLSGWPRIRGCMVRFWWVGASGGGCG